MLQAALLPRTPAPPLGRRQGLLSGHSSQRPHQAGLPIKQDAPLEEGRWAAPRQGSQDTRDSAVRPLTSLTTPHSAKCITPSPEGREAARAGTARGENAKPGWSPDQPHGSTPQPYAPTGCLQAPRRHPRPGRQVTPLGGDRQVSVSASQKPCSRPVFMSQIYCVCWTDTCTGPWRRPSRVRDRGAGHHVCGTVAQTQRSLL